MIIIGRARPEERNSAPLRASVLINQGNGAFAAHVTYVVDNQPRGIAAADLSGDGITDLAVTVSADLVYVLVNQGDGTFDVQAAYPVGDVPESVAAADLSGDGAPYSYSVSTMIATCLP